MNYISAFKGFLLYIVTFYAPRKMPVNSLIFSILHRLEKFIVVPLWENMVTWCSADTVRTNLKDYYYLVNTWTHPDVEPFSSTPDVIM